MINIRLLAISLASLTIVEFSSIPAASAIPCDTGEDCPTGWRCAGTTPGAPGICISGGGSDCSSTKPCPEAQHCAGINPNALGICVKNWPRDGACLKNEDCPGGFYCAGINPNAPGMCIAGGGEGSEELVDSTWRAIQIGSYKMPSETNLFVHFQDHGRWSGHGGCNNLFGDYRLAWFRHLLEIGDVGSTDQSCKEPIMDLERKFSSALEAVETFDPGSGPAHELVIYDGKGTELARFQQVGKLVGSTWRIILIGSDKMPSDTNLFVHFQDNGRWSGHGGCNDLGGEYTVAGSRVKIGPVGRTKMHCGEPTMELEDKFVVALEAIETFERHGPELVVGDGRGTELARFQQVESD